MACGVQAWETIGLVEVTEVELKEKTAGLSDYTGEGGWRAGEPNRPGISLANAPMSLPNEGSG